MTILLATMVKDSQAIADIPQFYLNELWGQFYWPQLMKHSFSGFTLVEMLVVIGIIAVLIGASFGSYNAFVKKASKGRCAELVHDVQVAIVGVMQKENAWPRGLLAAQGAPRDGILTKEAGAALAKRGVPVTLTMNSLYYIPEQYPLLAGLIAQCIGDGFRSFIIADPALLLYLHEQGLDREAQLHVSGEMSEVNHAMLAMVGRQGARRIIFHRKVTLNDMAACIAWAKAQPGNVPFEFEAFALNELCHFHGAFCNSLHCDELAHMCRVPYVLGGVRASLTVSDDTPADSDPTALGASGCGLCALWRMQRAGITHLKLVGRGNLSDLMVRDIAALRAAADLAAQCCNEQAYLSAMKKLLFPRGCPGACYYLGEFGAAAD